MKKWFETDEDGHNFFYTKCRKKTSVHSMSLKWIRKLRSDSARSKDIIEGIFPIFPRNAILDVSNSQKTQNAWICAGSVEIARRGPLTISSRRVLSHHLSLDLTQQAQCLEPSARKMAADGGVSYKETNQGRQAFKQRKQSTFDDPPAQMVAILSPEHPFHLHVWAQNLHVWDCEEGNFTTEARSSFFCELEVGSHKLKRKFGLVRSGSVEMGLVHDMLF